MAAIIGPAEGGAGRPSGEPAGGAGSGPQPWVRAPRVTLVAATSFFAPAHIDWQTDTDNPSQRLIEFAGRLCYRSFHNPSGRSNADYIARLLEQGHLSVLEHASASFLIEGISRSCSHEIVRHRHFSYSQVSQRYVDEARARMVLPPALADDPEAQRLLEEVARSARAAYDRLVEHLRERFRDVPDPSLRRKLARQAARSVLPNATETALVMTGNFRAWRHFVRMRASEHADAEIRRVAVEVLRQLQELAPAVFGDFRLRRLEDGTEVAEPGFVWE